MIRSQCIMEYSREINALLGNPKLALTSAIEDSKTVLKVNLYFLVVSCIYSCI